MTSSRVLRSMVKKADSSNKKPTYVKANDPPKIKSARKAKKPSLKVENQLDYEIPELDEIKPSYGKLFVADDNNRSSYHRLLGHVDGYGFSCRNMPKDGDCFYHAIIDQLMLQGRFTNQTVSSLRCQVTDYIAAHLPHFRPFMENDVQSGTYLTMHRKRGTWVDHAAMTALALALRVTLVVFSDDSELPTILRVHDAKLTLCLGLERSFHYHSLKLLADKLPDVINDFVRAEDCLAEPGLSETTLSVVRLR